MKRKAWIYWLAQIIGWGAYFVLSVLLLVSTRELRSTVNLYIFLASSIAVSILLSHTIRYIIIRRNLIAVHLYYVILWTLGLSLMAAIILEFFQFALTDYVIVVDFVGDGPVDSDQSFDLPNFSFAVFRSVLLFLLWTGFYMTFLFIERNRNQEMQQLRLDASANEIELKNLRAQLNPHFLFNSLNSIRALVGLDPEQAKSAITRLSALLRHSINLGKHQLVKLEDEMELVENYLELEQIRFEERLRVEYLVDPKSLKCDIPPLMVQTIVENAIKHGISKSIDGGHIKIKTKFEDQRLTIDIINSGQLNENLAESGVGIINTQKRLKILFGDKGTFNIRQEGQNVVAQIKIIYP